jgi:protein-arginine deiminase
MNKRPILMVGALAAIAVSGCGGGNHGGGGIVDGGDGGTNQPQSVIDLRADVNRDGTVDLGDPSEDDQEDTWDATHGAIFLANMDDDSLRCHVGTQFESDDELAGCFDAADQVVNGDEDLNDMARLRTAPWPDAPDDALGAITVTKDADKVRLFKNNGGKFEKLAAGGVLTPAELRAGVELALEGKDVLRDKDQWDGFVDVTLHVDGGTVPKGVEFAGQPYPSGDDVVRLRVAPVMFSHHLQRAEKVFATDADSDFFKDLGQAVQDALVPEGLVAAQPLSPDPWTQDWMEIGWMSMPAEGGGQHEIDVYMRSVDTRGSGKLRAAGRWVYESPELHGKDAAGLTPDHDLNHEPDMDSTNAYGNTETIPPYEFGGKSYPMGRLFRGSVPSRHPDVLAQHMFDSQGFQPMLTVDTSWLLVGHVDETISFVKMANARGWGMAVDDPALAKKMLEDLVSQGNGDVPIFEGESWDTPPGSAQTSANDILADPDVAGAFDEAVAEVDAQIQVFRDEVGITDADIIPVPFLHYQASGKLLAYQPATVNGIYLSDTDFGAPKTHGPIVGGKDPFATQLEATMGQHGITVRWIEDWSFHSLHGEVHCTSNTKRALPVAKWWETQL